MPEERSDLWTFRPLDLWTFSGASQRRPARVRRAFVFVVFAALCLCGSSLCGASARLTFIKEFPRSNPAYFSITLSEAGEGVYATAPDDPQPVTFRLSEALVKQFFEAATRLSNFQGLDLEAKTGQKVAFMGKKTLVYESGSTRNQASFNYSENRDAMALASAFEKIGATERLFLELERVVRFDRLGTYGAVQAIEASMNSRELMEPEQFFPLLEKVISDTRFMHVAQEHASAIVNRVKSGKYSPDIQLSPPTKN